MRPLHVAVVGAESSGKSWLTKSLASALLNRGQEAHIVDDVLGQWCQREGRTPLRHEQMAIAQQQADTTQWLRRSAPEAWLLSDSTPLVTAVYSQLMFDDESLYPMALAHHGLYHVTLVTGLDLPGVANGLESVSPQVSTHFDTLVRQALEHSGIAYRVVYGQGQKRLNNALLALGLESEDDAAQQVRDQGQFAINQGRSLWQCNDCSDPTCEHTLFSRLLKRRALEKRPSPQDLNPRCEDFNESRQTLTWAKKCG